MPVAAAAVETAKQMEVVVRQGTLPTWNWQRMSKAVMAAMVSVTCLRSLLRVVAMMVIP